MRPICLAAAGTLLALAAPAGAQHMGHMPGMAMPAPAAKPKPKPPARPVARPAAKRKPVAAQPAPRRSPAATAVCSPEHAAMGHCSPAPAPIAPPAPDTSCAPEHAAMGHCTPATAPTSAMPAMGTGGTALPPGNAPAPAAPKPDYADRIWGRAAMEPTRRALRREHGGQSFSQLMVNLAEVQLRNERDGYRWDGEYWYGGDIHRLTVKSEGEGSFRGDAEGEVQLLYSRAIDPYFNLQTGLRQDFAAGPDRTYATLGVEGLAPYWFEVEGAVFVSDRGDVLARVEGYYDQRITQRTILQPRVELNLSAQDIPRNRLGSGVTDAEIGLRLRHEIVREFAPYLGVSWERRFGDTARFARAAGERTGGFSLVAGVRTWF